LRKILAVSAIALLAFAGQAVASEGVQAFAPVGQVDYRVDADAAGGTGASNNFLGLDAITALSLLGGMIAVLALVVTQDDHGKSG